VGGDGDGGLFGPASMTWRVNREMVLLAGGGRALLLQVAHPLVAAGVEQHSNFDAQGIHGDPRVYAEPAAFRPERFLERTPEPYAYVPFGGGAHRCLGAALAMLEIELFLEAVIRRFQLTPSGPPARPVRRGITFVPANQGQMHVAPVPAVARPAAAGVAH
jgi:hypothetical protein